ncbi:MAG: hypothetical protein Q9164_005966 [Protoblastenia rupestris]
MKFLLTKGADVDSQASTRQRTALHGVIHSNDYEQADLKNIVMKSQMLLEHGADPMRKAEGGESLMHCAAERGYTEVLRLLLQYGADIEDDQGDFTPLMKAGMLRHLEATRLLLRKGARIDATLPNTERTVMALAFLGDPSNPHRASNSPLAIMRLLRDQSICLYVEQRHPFAITAPLEHWGFVEYLLDMEMDVQALEPNQPTYQADLLAKVVWCQNMVALSRISRARSPTTLRSLRTRNLYQACQEDLDTARGCLTKFNLGHELDDNVVARVRQIPLSRASMPGTNKTSMLRMMRAFREQMIDEGALLRLTLLRGRPPRLDSAF